MKTKQESNALRDENRKNATKIVFLEQQLLTKDKLFEEMYRAAFQQAKYPFNQIAGGRGIAAQSSIMSDPAKAQIQKNVAGTQIVNGLKRTIRELRGNIEMKDLEIEQMKRNVN